MNVFKILIIKTGILQKMANYITQYQIEKNKSDVIVEIQNKTTCGINFKFDSNISIRNEQADKSKIKIGSNTEIGNANLLIYKHGGEIIIGDHCFVGEGTKIWSAKKIEIGNRVLISHNVNIHDNNSHPINSLDRHADFKYIFSTGLPEVADYNEKQITINDDAWIGFNAIILKGIEIGKGAIVASGSVVTENVPDYAVVAGNPAKIVKYTK